MNREPSDHREQIVTPGDHEFRRVLGHFATGVTIITAMDGDEPVGVAANSFTSVSLDPPLILFCVGGSSTTWPRIERSGNFAVNILGEHHEHLSRLFAQKGADRFTDTLWRRGRTGAPLLEEAIAFVECAIEAQHPAGDHTIVVGRVMDLGMVEDAPPLLFYRGEYARLLGS